MFERQVKVGDGLGLDPLGRIDKEQCAFTGSQRTGDFIREINMARGINEVQEIVPAVLRPVSKADRPGFDGDPRSLSKSMESRTWATIFLALTAPVYSNNRSARVDFP